MRERASLPEVWPCRASPSARADDRPTVTIAVQQVATSASLEVVRERSNVGERVQQSIFETLIDRNLKSKLEPIPGLAESWKRIDERTVEFSLRKGVKFHNGDEMTSEDVVFTFGPERMFGYDYDSGASKTLFTTVLARDSIEGKKLPAEVVGIAKRTFPSLEKVESGRQVHRPLRQPRARRDARRPHRQLGLLDHQQARLHGGQDLDRLGAQADRDRPLQGARAQAGREPDPRRA